MPTCEVCSTEENIVYSGIDALLLGIDGAETERICYDCANKQVPTSCGCGNCDCEEEENNG